MRTNRLGLWLAVVALAGCANAVPGSSAGLSEFCEAEHTRPVVTTDGLETPAGSMTVSTDDTAITVHVAADAGWGLGDFYIAAGPGVESLTWFTINPEPWVTGYTSTVDISIPLADVMMACGASFKLIVIGGARDAAGVRHEVSALGTGSLGRGWYEFYDVCCEPPPPPPPEDEGCTLTQGYWKTHPEAWPVDSLTLGATSYTAAELRSLLLTAPRGDASLILAHQLIAAELNAASGASDSSDLAAAHAWLSANGSVLPYGTRADSAARDEAIALGAALASYNEGSSGPGHCDD
jgi:hypothetical protein